MTTREQMAREIRECFGRLTRGWDWEQERVTNTEAIRSYLLRAPPPEVLYPDLSMPIVPVFEYQRCRVTSEGVTWLDETRSRIHSLRVFRMAQQATVMLQEGT